MIICVTIQELNKDAVLVACQLNSKCCFIMQFLKTNAARCIMFAKQERVSQLDL